MSDEILLKQPMRALSPPTPLPRSTVLLFAIACGLSVANVYYAQPLLDALARDFGFSAASVGMVVTMTQAGCALALLLLVPLGDLLERRRLMLVQLMLLIVALLATATASTAFGLLAGMLALGLLGTAMTQGLIACAASAAGSAERGRVVGAAQGGVVIGLLLARTMAGTVADLADWRMVYLVSAALAVLLLIALWRLLPQQLPAATPLRYRALLRSMLVLLIEHRVLQIRGVIAMLMFAAFSIFWSAMVLPLSAPPYALSHAQIGAFGLVGVIGALGAARAGKRADQGYGQQTTGVAWLLLLAAWLPLALMAHGMWALVLGIVMLDLAGQAIHVTNQSMIFSGDSHSHSRLVACYMLFYAVGSGIGAIAATGVYAFAGWHGVCLLGAVVSLAGLLFWAWSLRHMPASAAATTGDEVCLPR